MEKARYGYHKRVSALERREIKSSRTIQEERVAKERKENPIFWVQLEDVNEEVLDQVVNIYTSVYEGNHANLKRPDFSDFSKTIANRGYLDLDLLGKDSTPLEVRRRIGANGVLYIRFRTMPKGSSQNGETPSKKRDEFQNKVDSFFIEKGVAVPLSQTF